MRKSWATCSNRDRGCGRVLNAVHHSGFRRLNVGYVGDGKGNSKIMIQASYYIVDPGDSCCVLQLMETFVYESKEACLKAIQGGSKNVAE